MLKRYRLYIPGIILFIISVVVAAVTYENYGISCDEQVQREVGLISYNYVCHGDTTLFHYLEKDHGVAYELPLIWLEKTLKLQRPQDIYHMRHLVGSLFFLCAAFCMYIISIRLFRDRILALLAFIMLVIHPRIYAHSFFNSKDIPFLIAVIFTLFFLQSAIYKRKTIWFALFGAAAAYATGIRVMGIVLLAVFIVIWAMMLFIRQFNAGQRKNTITNGLIAIGCYGVALYFFWPLLWQSPIDNFINTFNSFSHFRVDGYVLFQGQRLLSTQLPWYYIPTWLIITTPTVWVVFILAGIVLFPVIFIRQWKCSLVDSSSLFFVYCFFVAVLSVFSVIMLHSVVYDDWRHVYYIYPCLVLLGIFFIDNVGNTLLKNIMATFGMLQVMPVVVFMWVNHPYQHVYFNEMIPKRKDYLVKHYDMEYWGTSYRAALKYILNADKRSSLKVAYNQWYLGYNNILLLRDDERARIQIVNSATEADYYLTNFRYNPGEIKDTAGKVFEIQVLNSPIIRVLKMN